MSHNKIIYNQAIKKILWGNIAIADINKGNL